MVRRALRGACPRSIDAYNYSPLFAQVIWPLTLLPWAVFCAVLVGAAGAGVAWLLRPLPLVLAVGGWLACLPEILSGNIFWLLAVMAVVGFSHASAWCVAAFTKVLPCMGPVWFLARGEWRRLATFVVTALALLTVSVLISPQAWLDWVDFLRTSAGDSSGLIYLSPFAIPFPLAVRLPAGPRGGRGGRPDGPAVAGAGVDGAREPGRRVGHLRHAGGDPPAPRAGWLGRHHGEPELDADSRSLTP